jgi:hypothetical protein
MSSPSFFLSFSSTKIPSCYQDRLGTNNSETSTHTKTARRSCSEPASKNAQVLEVLATMLSLSEVRKLNAFALLFCAMPSCIVLPNIHQARLGTSTRKGKLFKSGVYLIKQKTRFFLSLQEDKVAIGLVTQWELERPMIAKKVVEKESGFGFGDAWTAFLAGDAS